MIPRDLGSATHCLLDGLATERAIGILSGEKPELRLLTLVVLAQEVKEHRGKRNVALLVSLAVANEQEHTLRVDVRHLQRTNLLEPRTAGVDGGHDGAVL